MNESNTTPLIGRDLIDQNRVRPSAPIRNLDEFLAFLGHVRAVMPPEPTMQRPPTTGDHFLL